MFFIRLTKMTLGRLRWRLLPLAGLVLVLALLPQRFGRRVESALTETAAMEELRLAVAAPEGDGTPELLEKLLGRMSDIREYCTFTAMGEEEARNALERGEVSAVLLLPENFIQAVQWGENPRVTLLVDETRRPLEALSTLWVGQSAMDLLTAVQTGIYAVLEVTGGAGLDRDRVVEEINFLYAQSFLNRGGKFAREDMTPTGALPLARHYQLSLFAFLLLLLPVATAVWYQGAWPDSLGRLRRVGRGWGCGFLSALLSAFLVMAVIAGISAAVLGLAAGQALLCALVWGSFLASYCGLVALLTRSLAGCGTTSLLLAMASAFVAGGILPTALLPEGVAALGPLSPVSWLRDSMARSLGYGAEGNVWILPVAAVVCAVLSALLYRRRWEKEWGWGTP